MIRSHVANGVMEICIDRPDKRNALSHDMYLELGRLVDAAGADATCAAVILYGAGGLFTAGADIQDFQTKRGHEDAPAVVFLRALARANVTLIAAVENFAIGIGATMLQHFDFVYAPAQTRFRMPFVALGLCPEGASTYLLEKIVGVRKARQWLLQCRYFDGTEARDAGFITELVAPGEALNVARQTAADLARLPRNSLRTAKRMLRETSQAQVTQAFDLEVRAFADLLNTDETQQIFKKFLDKAR
ncbi:enoyl-CoA hydratase/isomerase family protein [Polaromonas sp. SM01]|uniref:enoyl-CoA hydratase/isomerase family protein n=1 Tax=Polaromonas sp. SM01 TaxID=3085630 RepID=UPI0029813D95|nr:enoyl-CoA hydratase-related protein [Polaromonas sp. SM01]MDW5444901.1 enoyl-CoA hydratase-related protein [Polaromonas sp. SM01]